MNATQPQPNTHVDVDVVENKEWCGDALGSDTQAGRAINSGSRCWSRKIYGTSSGQVPNNAITSNTYSIYSIES
jgi:hypothetical protein